MRPELPDILRGYARDLMLAGPQYAAMAATLREAADALSPQNARRCAISADALVYDGDGGPGYGRCSTCED